MLPNEIEPFADHHIEKLQTIMHDVHANHATNTPKTFTAEEVVELCKVLDGAASALTRFKICMADEVKQKDRYRQYAQENGYPYS